MTTSPLIHLTDDELRVLEHAMRHDKRPAVRQRATAMRLLHLGHSPSAVATMHAVSIPTIYAWIARWQSAKTVDGLANQPKPGRPSKADQTYHTALAQVLERDPRDVGYDFTIWTVERLRHHLAKETGLLLSEPRLRTLMKQHGYRYRRPKTD